MDKTVLTPGGVTPTFGGVRRGMWTLAYGTAVFVATKRRDGSLGLAPVRLIHLEVVTKMRAGEVGGQRMLCWRDGPHEFYCFEDRQRNSKGFCQAEQRAQILGKTGSAISNSGI